MMALSLLCSRCHKIQFEKLNSHVSHKRFVLMTLLDVNMSRCTPLLAR